MRSYAIFDLDGTLLDSMYIWKNAASLFLQERNIEPLGNLYEELKTMSVKQAAEYLNNRFQLSLPTSEIIEGIKRVVEKQYVEEVQLKPFAHEYIQHLKGNHVRMCIATASEYNHAEAALKRLKIFDYFDFILTCSEVGYGKDRPIIYQKAARKWGVKPKEVVVFEDALHAVQTAKAAGFYTIGFYDESAKEEADEIKKIADLYFDHWDEVSL